MKAENLITFSEVRKKTGISPQEFRTWKAYGLLPRHVKKIGLGQGKGFECFYFDSIIDIIFRIRNLRKQGFKFIKIKKIIKEYLRTGISPQELIFRQAAISDLKLSETKGEEISTERLLRMWINKSKKRSKQTRSKIIKDGKTQNIPRLTTTTRKRGAFPSKQSKTRSKSNKDKGGDDDGSDDHLGLRAEELKSRDVLRLSRLFYLTDQF